MTKKFSMIFAAIVVAVLFSFIAYSQEQGQEAPKKSAEKTTVTYDDLQTQKKKIDGLKKNYSQAEADYDSECTGKEFKSIADFQKICTEKNTKLSKQYEELAKEIDSYNKNVAQYKTQGRTK